MGGLYDALIDRQPGSVQGFCCRARFRDIGTPADYLRTCLEVAREEGLVEVPASEDVVVHPSARVTNSVLFGGVTLGANVVLDHCVAADGVSIPDGMRFAGRVIVPAGCAAACPAWHVTGDLLASPLDMAQASSPRKDAET